MPEDQEIADAIRPYADEINQDLDTDVVQGEIVSNEADLKADFNKDIGKKPSYSLEEKMLVVEMVRRNGGVIDKAIVSQAQIMLHSASITNMSIRNWWIKFKDVPPAEILKKAYGEWTTPKDLVARGVDPKAAVLRDKASAGLDKTLEKVAEEYLKRALDPAAIAATKGRDAVWAAAVSIDKMRLLRTVSSEIIDILPSIIDLMEKKGINPINAFKDMYAALLRS